MEINRDHQQTFDQGRIRSLELAFATFVRMQQAVPVDVYCDVLKKNVETWSEATLDMAVTDDYRNGVEFGSQLLLSHLLNTTRD